VIGCIIKSLFTLYSGASVSDFLVMWIISSFFGANAILLCMSYIIMLCMSLASICILLLSDLVALYRQMSSV